MGTLNRCAEALARHVDAEAVAVIAIDEEGRRALAGRAGRAGKLLGAPDRCGAGPDGLCAKIASGRVDSALACSTDAGSFHLGRHRDWPPELLAACRAAPAPCACTTASIESLLVVPLRSPWRSVGLVQLADPRPVAFDERTVAFVERLALELGSAVDNLRIAAARDEMTRRLLDTTERIAAAIEQVRRSQSFDYRIESPQPGGDAPGAADPSRHREIIESFNSMLAALKDKAEQVSSLQQQMIGTEKLTALGQLIAGVAHELNNPLAAVVGFAKAIVADPRCPGWLHDDLEQIDQSAERCRRIVGGLLDFAREHPHEQRQIDVNEVLERALGMVGPHLRTAGIELVRALDPALPPTAGDAHQLERVFFNIVHNAYQALSQQPAGARARGHRITARSAHAVDDVGREGWLRVELLDNGPGMPAEVAARAFEPFFTTKPVGEGTGLGLAIAHGIVAGHGGRLQIDSAPGQGTCVTVELPCRSAAACAHPRRAGGSRVSLEGIRVLVIDDEMPIRKVAKRLLEADGAEVETADGGQAGLERLESNRFDCILLDVRMGGGLDGPETFEHIQSQHPDATGRVLFMSGDTGDPALRELASRCRCGLLAKPFTPADLAVAVRRAAGGSIKPG